MRVYSLVLAALFAAFGLVWYASCTGRLCWATVVAAELIAAQSGLGFRMQQAQLYYDLPTIFVSLITIGILGLVMDRLLQAAERRLTRWQERAQ